MSLIDYTIIQMIKDEVYMQQTVMLKDYMLAPVFVAIHWLIHYKETAYEEQRTMVGNTRGWIARGWWVARGWVAILF